MTLQHTDRQAHILSRPRGARRDGHITPDRGDASLFCPLLQTPVCGAGGGVSTKRGAA